jgi:hypothetical protein
LDFSLRIEATGSHVPHKGLVQVHATSMPDVAQAGCRLLLDLSRSNDSSRFRHHPYAFDTFPVVHSLRLPATSPDAVFAAPFPSTLTTPALDRSSSWWFGACLCRPARGAHPHPLCSKAASKLAVTSRPPFRAVVAHSRRRSAQTRGRVSPVPCPPRPGAHWPEAARAGRPAVSPPAAPSPLRRP